ncbi:hypothetical protein HF086_012156 [Spodoptera exigua]|uniref:Fructose-bisphosphate aldolase n=1 Tax=Spodoptera exigua TaxID=7107 RepID=A0A922SBS5_SPOEX|nr:hypothetical protein HF086_012156 [Spodoptera exigua]
MGLSGIWTMTTHFSYPEPALQKELRSTAEAIVAPGKGILAVDETNEGIGKLLAAVGLENTENNRRRYRQLLFTTQNLSEHVSATILFDETVYQKTDDGTPFMELLKKNNIIPGIKLDLDAVPLFLSQDEVTTQGLDNLATRCAEYKKQGCRFAKWRCPLRIGENIPSVQAVNDTAQVLASEVMVAIKQTIFELILLICDHDIVRDQKVTETALAAVYKALNDHHVFLEGTLLKPNMIFCNTRSDIHCANLIRIAFLSGGLTEEEATVYLNAINQANGLACQGKYQGGPASSAGTKSNFAANHRY